MRQAMKKWLNRHLTTFSVDTAHSLCNSLGLDEEKIDECLGLCYQLEKGDINEADFTVGLATLTGKKPEEVVGVLRDIKQVTSRKFIVYHTTPASNIDSILKYGIQPRAPYYEQPKEPVVYIASSVEIAKDYAEQAYEMGKTPETRWAIFKIQYDEFPDEVYPDLMWGIPGVHFVKIPIPTEHLELIDTFEVLRGMKREKVDTITYIGQSSQFNIMYHVGNIKYLDSVRREGIKVTYRPDLIVRPCKPSPFRNKPMAVFLSQDKEYVEDVVWGLDYEHRPVYLATVNMEWLQVWQEHEEPIEETYSWFYPGDIPVRRVIKVEELRSEPEKD